MKLSSGGLACDVLCDSECEGTRITSVILTMPRYLLAELNTHKVFCLSGDTELEFDLPAKKNRGLSQVYRMTLREFAEKWFCGVEEHRVGSLKCFSLENILPTVTYSAKDLSKLCGMKSPSNIRTWCRTGRLITMNPNKLRGDDFLILGKDFIDFMRTRGVRTFAIRDRLMGMNIRQLNERTGLIQHSHISNCYVSLPKKLYRLTTENGSAVKCSEDHLILTEAGWKKLKELDTTSDKVIVQKCGASEGDRKDPLRLRKIEGKWVCQWIRENKAIWDKRQSGICNSCKKAGIKEHHHIISVSKDPSKAFDIDNVEGLCVACHNAKHAEQDWGRANYLYGAGDSIVSIVYAGIEETYDLEIAGEFPNFAANGIIVHNSRNSASSRAIPSKTILERVKKQPFIPLKVATPAKGMTTTNFYSDEDSDKFIAKHLDFLKTTVTTVEELLEMGMPKSLANRYLEFFMFTDVLVTATEWANFLRLRRHVDAEVHFTLLAELTYQALKLSIPEHTDMHLPFLTYSEKESVSKVKHKDDFKNLSLVHSSVVRCARISYFTHGQVRDDEEEKFKGLTTGSGFGHWSPFEHVAVHSSVPFVKGLGTGCFKDWVQLRKFYPQENLPGHIDAYNTQNEGTPETVKDLPIIYDPTHFLQRSREPDEVIVPTKS